LKAGRVVKLEKHSITTPLVPDPVTFDSKSNIAMGQRIARGRIKTGRTLCKSPQILNVANVVENLAVAFPEVSRNAIGDLVRQRRRCLARWSY
jgi:hypothetical protein